MALYKYKFNENSSVGSNVTRVGGCYTITAHTYFLGKGGGGQIESDTRGYISLIARFRIECVCSTAI
jgi:hypothetical protein